MKKELLSCGDGWVQHGPTVALAAKKNPERLLETESRFAAANRDWRDLSGRKSILFIYIYTHIIL
jgi:hypothetical protein